MPTPLVMLGSGDYTTRLNVKGTGLRLLKGNPAADANPGNPDPENQPNHSGYHRPSFKRGKFSSLTTTPAAKLQRGSDTFDLTAPLHAAAAWLQFQTLTLSDLADAHTQTAANLPAYKATDAIGGLSLQPHPHPIATPAFPPFVHALLAAKARLRAVANFTPPQPRITITRPAARFNTAPTPSNLTLNPRATHEPHPQTTGHPQPHPRNPADPRLFADDAGTRRRTRSLQSHGLRTRRGPDQKRSPHPAGQQSPLFGSLA